MGTKTFQYRKTFANYREQEHFVGISGYTTSTPPLGGKIKQTISDFIVREITPSGEILSTFEGDNPKIPYRAKLDRATLFTLIKKNTDTIHAAEAVQRFLEIPLHHLKWAGIKDHTAITAQKFSVKGNWVEKLAQFKHRDISITNIRPAHHEIDIGQLWGNHFTINIRKLFSPYQEIEAELTQWQQEIVENGFPNFYGMQRFGKHRPNSHIVGKAIFQKRYQEAVEEFLFSVYPAEFDEIAEFRSEYGESRDYARAIKECPRGLSYELTILKHLAMNPDDYKGAIASLPPALLNLIMSAFQSHLFNITLSNRLKTGHSLSHPLKGDRISILKDEYGHPSLVFYQYQGGDGWNDENILKAFKHNRAAVIAPIVGYKTNLTKYPRFEQEYDELFEQEQFHPQQFRHGDRRLLNFEGAFRVITNRPRNMEISQAYLPNKYPVVDPKGIKLSFSLPKGTYATLLMRELRKPN